MKKILSLIFIVILLGLSVPSFAVASGLHVGDETTVNGMKATVVGFQGGKPVYQSTVSPNIYTTASNGQIYTYANAVYANARTPASGDVVDTWNGADGVCNNLGGGFYQVIRTFLFFDTSFLSGYTPTAANVNLYVVNAINTNNENIQVQTGGATYPHDPIVAGDYDLAHYTGNGGAKTIGSFANGVYNTITLNSTGYGWINTAGTTKYCLRTSGDIGNSTPTGSNFVAYYTFQAGAPYQPYLVVTYVPAGSMSGNFTSLSSLGTLHKTDVTYSVAQSATTGAVLASGYTQVGQDATYDVQRSYYYFDTTAIPSYATITSVDYNFYSHDKTGVVTDFDLVISKGLTSAHPADPLVVGEYNKLYYSSAVGGTKNTSAVTNAAWNTITLTADMLTLGGETKLIMRSGNDISATAPTGNEFIEIGGTGDGNLPYLTIVYSVTDITTLDATNITPTSVRLQGYVNNMRGVTVLSALFEYGTSTSYGKGKTQTSVTNGYYYVDVTGLTLKTKYHYRALVDYTGSGIYTTGLDKIFTTAPASGTSDTLVLSNVGVFSGYITPSTGATVTNGTGMMTGSPVTLLATENNTPTVTVAGTFTVVVPSGTTVVVSTGGWTVTGSGTPAATFTANGSFIVQAGGSGTINVKFATDMLIVVENYCFYTGYYPNKKPGDVFQVRLYDTDLTTILAASPIQNWGDRPASIYLNSAVVKNLTVGAAYGVQLFGYNAGNARDPQTPYALTEGDWYGTDLTSLDNLCRAIALNMGVTDNKSDYTAILSNGQTVIDTATGYFVSGVPDIATIRPNLFTTSELKITFPPTTNLNSWDNPTAYQTYLGTNISSDLTIFGTPIGKTGKDVAAGLIWLVVLMVIGMTVSNGAKPLGAALICIPLIWLGTYFKILPVQQLTLLCIIFGFFFIRQFIIKTT